MVRGGGASAVRATRVAIGIPCALLAAGLLAALSLGCSGGDTRADGVWSGETAALEIQRGSFQNHVLLTGELQAVHSTRIIVPRIPNWQMPIRWIEEDGVRVEAGQRVIELDNSQFAGELEQKRLAVDTALNNLMRKEADLAVALADQGYRVDQARIELEKARIEAAVPESILSRRDFQEAQLALARAEVGFRKAEDQLQADREAADAELEELRIALTRARGEVRTAEEAIEALTLRAPAAGILVVDRNRREGRKFQIGDNVSVGQGVAEIPDLSEWKVAARLSDVDDGKIAVGMKAISTLDTFPDLQFHGTVVEIGPVATPDSRASLRRAFDVTIVLDDADPERMRPGMSVRSEVLTPVRDDVLLAPRAALRIEADRVRIRLAEGGTPAVELGPCSARQCVIEAGPEAGTPLEAWR